MPWQPLSATLATKPHVLAGPVLRKVTPRSVTVWLALRVGGNVTLKVLDAGGTLMASGKRHSVAVGTNLHIVAVTAIPKPADPDLVEGVVYRYDMSFDFDGGLSTNFATATNNAPLGYAPFTQPTFCLPPKDLNSLRLIHGSCRMPHGNGMDLLPLVGELISQTAATPLQRPHQLLLTGDQIYADDVAASMLVMLTDASDALLGWKEVLPVPAQYSGLNTGAKLSPFMRRELLAGSGFTSEDLDSHLMTMGEYLCMYLFVWSDVLWSATTLPLFADVDATVKVAFGESWPTGFTLYTSDTINGDIKDMVEFASGLGDVRKVLANIPSYMILDDHEVTDDFNMTLDICLGLYGNPLGRRVVKNGLVAYSLCQHWGNVPEQFAESDPSLPGTTLLQLLDGGDAARYEANSSKIDALVSVHTDTEIDAKGCVFHGSNSLIFNYTVEGPGHQVIVTDTRTWRTFPRLGGEAPDLLPPQQFVEQIQQIKPATDGRALLVVITTNAPPIESIRSATRHDWIANHVRHYPDIHEAWDLPSDGFDRLMKSVTDRLPLASGEHRGPVILLSGDVHTSFATRLLYQASSRFEDKKKEGATAVIAQLVASSWRKQTGDTLDEQGQGYTYSPHWYVDPLIGPHVTEYYAGWNLPLGSKVTVGRVGGPSDFVLSQSASLRLTQGFAVKKAPDYIYQLDYLPITKGGTVPNKPQPLPPLPAGATLDERKQALKAFNVATGNYRQYNIDAGGTKQIIGMNNMSEVTFDWPATDQKKVIHTVRWREPISFGPLFVDYVVSLDPNDKDFAYSTKTFAVKP